MSSASIHLGNGKYFANYWVFVTKWSTAEELIMAWLMLYLATNTLISCWQSLLLHMIGWMLSRTGIHLTLKPLVFYHSWC